MPASPFKTKSFHLTALDRELLDPDHGGLDDISWWYRAYFDGELYPWQHYFYHHPANDQLVVAGIRSGEELRRSGRMTDDARGSASSRIRRMRIQRATVQHLLRPWLDGCCPP